MHTAEAVTVALVSLLVVAVLSVAAWQLGWFVEAKNVDRRTQVDNLSTGRQQAIQSAFAPAQAG